MRELEPYADLGRVERMIALRSFSGWHDLSAPELASLAELARPYRARAGQTLIGAGEPVDHIFLIVRGALTSRAKGLDLGRFQAGEAVGGIAAWGEAEGYEVLAVADSVVLAMNAGELEELYEDRFAILARVLRRLARQAIALRRRSGGTAGFPAEAAVGAECPARRLDLVERIVYLRRSLGMQGSSIDSVAVLAKTAEEIRLAPGERLWSSGEPASFLVAILCGRVRGTTPEGQRFELGAGDLAGALDVVADLPRWYECEVIDGLVGLRLSRDITFDLWEDHPELPRRMLGALSRQVLALTAASAK